MLNESPPDKWNTITEKIPQSNPNHKNIPTSLIQGTRSNPWSIVSTICYGELTCWPLSMHDSLTNFRHNTYHKALNIGILCSERKNCVVQDREKLRGMLAADSTICAIGKFDGLNVSLAFSHNLHRYEDNVLCCSRLRSDAH